MRILLSELTLPTLATAINVKLVTGQLCIGLLLSKTEELFPTLELNQVASQKLLQLVLQKFSNVGTLVSNNLRKARKLPSIAHLTYHGEELTHKPHLAENQSLSILTLISKLKFWNATESQKLLDTPTTIVTMPLNTDNQEPLPCNLTDPSGSISKSPSIHSTTWFSQRKTVSLLFTSKNTADQKILPSSGSSMMMAPSPTWETTSTCVKLPTNMEALALISLNGTTIQLLQLLPLRLPTGLPPQTLMETTMLAASTFPSPRNT